MRYPLVPSPHKTGELTLVTDADRAGTRVSFAFSTRAGGYSKEPYASLNLGTSTGDDPAIVDLNRRALLSAIGAPLSTDALFMPHQVHGDDVVVLRGTADDVASGVDADAVVCMAPGKAVLLLFADCSPVVLVAPEAFAVIHSGWRGTLAGIAGKALDVLVAEAGCDPHEVNAYVGPHIHSCCYEVSPRMVEDFTAEFGPGACLGRNLDMFHCIRASLMRHGADPSRVVDSGLCTGCDTRSFFSHRMEAGLTGRHGAIAFMA